MARQRLLQRRKVQRLLGGLGAFYIWLARRTGRLQVIGAEHPAKYWDQGQPVILAPWHGRLVGVPYMAPADVTVCALTSLHKDGQIVGDVLTWSGGVAVKGSSTRGGVSGFRQMMKAAKAGNTLLITPDAPPQMRYTCAKGVAELARLTGLPVIPCAFSSARGKQLKTKDRLVIPRLFTRLLVCYGPPLMIGKNASEVARAAFLKDIEEALQTVTHQADAEMGRPEWSNEG